MLGIFIGCLIKDNSTNVKHIRKLRKELDFDEIANNLELFCQMHEHIESELSLTNHGENKPMLYGHDDDNNIPEFNSSQSLLEAELDFATKSKNEGNGSKEREKIEEIVEVLRNVQK